jgi:hypothetical protein
MCSFLRIEGLYMATCLCSSFVAAASFDEATTLLVALHKAGTLTASNVDMKALEVKDIISAAVGVVPPSDVFLYIA